MALSRRLAAVSSAAVLSLSLAACGGDDTAATDPGAGASASAPSQSDSAEGSVTAGVSEEHNEADTTFVQGMIPHHRQAVMMSELALDRAESPEVMALAEQINAAQGPEIDTMTGMLEVWGEEIPEDMPMGETEDMEGMDHGGMEGMSGMMTPEQMGDLESQQGAAFDRMFLEMMVEHHTGAIEMAQTQQADGENPEAIELAGQIESSQTEEIEEMQEVLAAL